MKQQADTAVTHWLQTRADVWRRHEELLERQRGRKDIDSDEVLEFAHGYRSLSRDLSLARNTLPDSNITRYLENLLLQSYDIIHRKPYSLGYQARYLLQYDVPQAMRELRGPILASATIFILSCIIGWLLVYQYPELASLFASPAMIEEVQQGSLWTDDLINVLPSSVLSNSILMNNIAVTFFAFGLGAFYGLGTLYIMGLNGLMLGGVFAFTHHYNMADRLFEFVIAHGVVELSVIVLAGAAGIKLGEALVRPGQLTRREAFQRAAALAGKLLAVGAPLLVGAGIIEGYISPNPDYDLATRMVVGFGYGIFMLLLLSGRLFPKRKLATEAMA